jgi:hypothetical protein
MNSCATRRSSQFDAAWAGVDAEAACLTLSAALTYSNQRGEFGARRAALKQLSVTASDTIAPCRKRFHIRRRARSETPGLRRMKRARVMSPAPDDATRRRPLG